MHPDDFRTWPQDFAALEADPPEGWAVSRRILDPVLFVRAAPGGGLSLELGARRTSRGTRTELLAPGIEYNWVHDGSSVSPLPRDVSAAVRKTIKGLDPKQLSFPQAIALHRSEDPELPVVIDPRVFEPANAQSSHNPAKLDVPGLNATLYGYQARGITWLRQTLARAGGAIMADEMGLGKTIQILGTLLLDRPTLQNPALVVCPTTLIANWVREIGKFAPSLDVMVHRGPDRGRLPRQLQRSSVLITTYDTAVNDLVLFKAIEWSYLICDEAQALKNPDSQRRIAISEIPRRKTVPVTGTPVENTLLDLWSLTDIAIPGLLGTRKDFEKDFPDTEDGAHALSEITNPVVLKRQVRDVAQDLPERIDIEVPVELGSDLGAEYDRVLTDTLERYPQAGALVATGQLALFCAHPWLVSRDAGQDDGWEERVTVARNSGVPLLTPKMERAIELIEEAFENGKKVLLFANYNACGPLLQEAGRRLPSAFWGAINGSTPSQERQAIVDSFGLHHGPAILVLNPRAAGSGLNITAATVVIHYTQVWNPALELQASARAHRRGQTEPVTICHMFYVDTVEEVMMERAKRRRRLGNEAVPVRSQEQADLEQALRMTPVRR